MLDQQNVLENLMKRLEAWRTSRRISDEVDFVQEAHETSQGDPLDLTEEEKELRHAYDLMQRLISQLETKAGAA